MKIITVLLLLIVVNIGFSQKKISQKPRTIVTTDGEIDDVDSFIRMLLYANEFKIEGLVYSSSMWQYKGDGKGTKMTSEMEMTKKIYGEKTDLRWPGINWMQELINEYEKVYPNLIKNAKEYPSATYLRKLIKVGNIDFEGQMDADTEGSNFIKNKLLDNELTPIYLQVWGGTNTIARALKSIEDQYKTTANWKNIYTKVCKKTILYAILDQDATYKNYIAKTWPDIKIYYNANQFACLAYPWQKQVPEPMHYLLEGKFMSENIINNHGPLLAKYYSYGDGQKQTGDDEHIHGDPNKLLNAQWGSFNKYDFISEGDSPAFLHLINVGLDNLNNPHFGGWGGRLKQSNIVPSRWEDGKEVADFNPITNKIDVAYPQTRWLEALQNDFAARADWCISDYKSANHTPIIKAMAQKEIKVKAASKVKLICLASDPDLNQLSYKWWQYEEVGTFKGKVNIENTNSNNITIKLPEEIKPNETIHIIVEVSDNGKPKLTKYQRFVLKCI